MPSTLPDPDRGQRTVPRHRRDRERDRGRHGAQDVGVVLLIGGEHGDEDLDLVLEAFGEERPDAPVDESAGQDLLVGRPALALQESAGDLARGVGLLAIFDGEGEERQGGDVGRDGDGGEEHGIAELHQRGARGLLRQAAGLDHETAPGEILFDPLYGHVGFQVRAHQCSEGAPLCSFGAPSRTRGP